MIFLKGDWEFHANVVHVPRWDNAINMCPCCSASNTILALLWTQNGWRDTKRSHREFLEAMRDQGRTISGIWLIKTLTVRGFIWDVLHALDLGLSSHVNANVYVELMDDGVFGNGTMASKVSNLEADLKNLYKNNYTALQGSCQSIVLKLGEIGQSSRLRERKQGTFANTRWSWPGHTTNTRPTTRTDWL